jgi:Secretion system C-terminal sorting domain
VDFDPGIGIFNLNSNTGFYSDMFVLKLDPSGNFIWAKNMGGALSEYSSSAVVDASGNVYTTGSFSGSADFDPGPNVYTLNSGTMFISKLDNSGNFVWAKSVLASSNSITLDQNNHVYTTGSFVGVVDFDPGVTVVNVTGSNSVWQDLFILKLDSAGNFIWAQGMGGTSGLYGASIVVDANFNVYTNGKYEGTIDFDPSAAQFNLTGTMDLFIHKINQQHSVGIIEMGKENASRVFPTPVTDVLTIQSSNEINSITIYNALGENVFEKISRVERTVQIDLSGLPRGVYSIRIANDYEIQVEKIVKQ